MIAAESLIFTCAAEQTVADLPLLGDLPAFVRGTIYLNGPAGFREGRHHWLDGDGLVRALRIEENRIGFRSRYVRTRRFEEESAAERPIYRSFGTAFSGDRLIAGKTLATPANVSAYPFAGKLLAFGEQSLPYVLDPKTLETQGEIDFGERLSGIGALSAHPKFEGGRMADFGIRYLGPRARLYYYECDQDLKVVVRNATVLATPNVIHDFALSRNHAIFHIGPYTLNARKLMKEGTSLLDAMAWEPRGDSFLYVFARREDGETMRIDLPETRNCLHLVNAFEDGGQIIVDLLETDTPYYADYTARPHMFTDLGETRVRRCTIEAGSLVSTDVVPLGCHADFPAIACGTTGRRHDRFWMLAMPAPAPNPKFYDRLLCFQSTVSDHWRADAWLGGEPVVIADPESDDVVVACQHFCGEGTSGWLFFDGHNLRSGPIARLDLPGFDPPGFHSAWCPQG